jgi:hypothetical protein
MATLAVPVRLSEATIVDLVTYKRDGIPVHTPVLSTPREGVLLIRTHPHAGKLKRLRNNSRVEVTPHDSRGRVIGPSSWGTARVLAPAETSECLELLHRRHGLIGYAATWLRHLRGWRDVFIEVQPD